MAPPKRRDHDDDDDNPGAKSSGQITSSPKKRPRHDDDDEGPVEQRPSLSKKSPAGSSSPIMMIGGLIGVGALLLLCCGGVGVGGFFMMNREPAPPKPDAAPIAKNKDKPGDAKDGKDANKDEVPPNVPFDKVDDKKPDDRIVIIKPPPVKPFNHVADAAVSILTEADSQVRNLAFAEQAPRAAVFFWGKQNLDKIVDVWDWQAGKRVSRITIGDDPGLIQLSPTGTRLLVRERFPPKLSLWSVNDAKQLVKDWDPFPKDPKQPFGARQELVWAYLLSDDRVLSIARSGQFFVWNLTTNQPVYSIPAPKNSRFLTENGFAKMPQDFALSPDRRILAVNNKDGFDLFDTATGNLFGKTSSFAAEGSVGNTWSVAFNRAGNLLAFRHNLHVPGGKQQECITVWEIPSGKRKWHYPVPTDFDTNGPIAFVGARHLMVFDGNVFKATLFGLDDGRYHRVLKTSGKAGDRFGVAVPDDRIWYVTRSVFNAPGFLVAVNLPEADLAQNPAPQVNQPRLLPMWGCYPTMVRRVNANEL